MKITAIRGFNDVLPDEMGRWHFFEDSARRLFESFGFSEIRIPVVEKNELFVRGIGEATDIVEKEMFTFPDRHGEMITLRPEGTASVARAYIEHSFFAQDAVAKLCYAGPMFRYERPQKGRYRQFYQIGAEVLGVDSPLADAETISMLVELFKRTGIKEAVLQINSIGCKDCRSDYKSALVGFLEPKKENLCPDCRRRMTTNPLRVLDCKNSACISETGNAPSILDTLCQPCSSHFQEVRDSLDMLGTKYSVNHRMVRGLDYYQKTTFEIVSTALGSQNAIAAGGRYDGLIKDLGGPEVSGFGFAVGMERAVSLIGLNETSPKRPLLFIATIGDAPRRWSLKTKYDLAVNGIRAEIDYEGKSIKSQMRKADKSGVRFAIVIGDNEISNGKAVLKDMSGHKEEEILLSSISERMLSFQSQGVKSDV